MGERKKQATKARRAYELGRMAGSEGRSVHANPFRLRSHMGLSGWWEKGWKEGAENERPSKQ